MRPNKHPAIQISTKAPSNKSALTNAAIPIPLCVGVRNSQMPRKRNSCLKVKSVLKRPLFSAPPLIKEQTVQRIGCDQETYVAKRIHLRSKAIYELYR
jgi:hypothetical protein